MCRDVNETKDTITRTKRNERLLKISTWNESNEQMFKTSKTTIFLNEKYKIPLIFVVLVYILVTYCDTPSANEKSYRIQIKSRFYCCKREQIAASFAAIWNEINEKNEVLKFLNEWKTKRKNEAKNDVSFVYVSSLVLCVTALFLMSGGILTILVAWWTSNQLSQQDSCINPN